LLPTIVDAANGSDQLYSYYDIISVVFQAWRIKTANGICRQRVLICSTDVNALVITFDLMWRHCPLLWRPKEEQQNGCLSQYFELGSTQRSSYVWLPFPSNTCMLLTLALHR
jgi:hypothetical protein